MYVYLYAISILAHALFVPPTHNLPIAILFLKDALGDGDSM